MSFAVGFRVAVRVASAGGVQAAARVTAGRMVAQQTGSTLFKVGRRVRLLKAIIGDEAEPTERVRPQYNITVTATVDASEALNANRVRLSRISNMSPVWDYIADDFATKEGTVFKRGGASSGFSKWAPLTQSTINRKLNSPYRKNASRILVRSGKLRSSLTQRSHPNFIFRSTRRHMEIGTSVKYAGIHDAGDPKSGLPQRTLIRIPDKVRRKWNSVILRHLVKTKSFGFERLG